MEVNVLKEEKNIIEIELKGEGHTLANLLRSELWNNNDIEIASYNLKHPIASSPILALSVSKGKPKKAIQEAVESLKAKTKEFKNLLKKLD